MANGDIWKVDVVQNLQGVSGVNVFYFEQIQDTNNPQGDILSLAGALTTDLLNLWKIWASDQLNFNGYRIQKWIPKATFPSIITLAGETGQVAGDPLPTTKAALATVYSVRTDRSGIGRNYYMGVPESSTTRGVWKTAEFGPFKNFITKLDGSLQEVGDTASYKLGVYSQKNLEFNQEFDVQPRSAMFQQRSRQATAL